MIEVTREWRILEIIDTRCYDREAGHTIPGTGDPVPCECCGRSIEIHSHLIHKETKERATVGTQCAKKAGLKFGPEFVSPTTKSWWKFNYMKRVQTAK